MQLNLKTIENVGHDVYRIKLSADDTLNYAAGQYLLVNMSEDDQRPFSIASSPSKDRFIELHIGATPENPYAWDVIEQLRTKGSVQVSLANGTAQLQPSEKDIILVAGGTGYSYVKSIAFEATTQGLENQIHIFWGAKQDSQLYEAALLQQLADEHDNVHFHPVVEQPDTGWQGATGWVHHAVLQSFPDLSPFQVYIAGPFPMAKVARDDFYAAGLATDDLFGDAYAFI
jgi:aquacobalamin reductase/NAD(P)H-flavin reductase